MPYQRFIRWHPALACFWNSLECGIFDGIFDGIFYRGPCSDGYSSLTRCDGVFPPDNLTAGDDDQVTIIKRPDWIVQQLQMLTCSWLGDGRCLLVIYNRPMDHHRRCGSVAQGDSYCLQDWIAGSCGNPHKMN